MTDDPVGDVIEILCEMAEADAMTDYLARGRRFADVPAEQLERRWIAAFKAWGATLDEGTERENDDLASELRLRGQKAVAAEVLELRPVLDRLRAFAAEHADERDVRRRIRELLKRLDQFN
jgi:hypothetical protein